MPRGFESHLVHVNQNPLWIDVLVGTFCVLVVGTASGIIPAIVFICIQIWS